MPSGKWMRVWSPQASRNQMSPVRMSQHLLSVAQKDEVMRTKGAIVLFHFEVGWRLELKRISLPRFHHFVTRRLEVLGRGTALSIVQTHAGSRRSGLVKVIDRNCSQM